jgi:hypothetical protein
MKTRIALAAGMLLTLGTAVSGTLRYGTQATPAIEQQQPQVPAVEPTPEMIAFWKATARTRDYVPPKLPI